MENTNRLLIVDDQFANLRLLQHTFEDEGFKVQTANNVEAAKQLLLAKETPFDLVLSDIQMPGQTGFDLVRWAKTQPIAEIPILLITSQLPEPQHRILGLTLGAVDYVPRSLDAQELVARVRRAIASFKQLRRLQANLEDSENLAAVGRALAAANHEVKNLAQMILLSGNILKKHLVGTTVVDPAVARQALNGLLESSSLLTEMTKSMHSMLDKDSAQYVPVDIAVLSHQVINMMRPILKSCYLNTANLPERGIWVSGCAIQLKQVLINLLLNAREAIREGMPDAGGEISLGLQALGNNQTVLEVTDNGVGLPIAETRSDFPAFATTKQLRGGKGLGLWLGSRFIEGMGGTLILTSQGPGSGVTASITLTSTAAPQTAPTFDLTEYLDDWPH